MGGGDGREEYGGQDGGRRQDGGMVSFDVRLYRGKFVACDNRAILAHIRLLYNFILVKKIIHPRVRN